MRAYPGMERCLFPGFAEPCKQTMNDTGVHPAELLAIFGCVVVWLGRALQSHHVTALKQLVGPFTVTSQLCMTIRKRTTYCGTVCMATLLHGMLVDQGFWLLTRCQPGRRSDDSQGSDGAAKNCGTGITCQALCTACVHWQTLTLSHASSDTAHTLLLGPICTTVLLESSSLTICF